LLLVAAVPVALLAGRGHNDAGTRRLRLALSGGSILAAAIAVALAGMSGMLHLRKLLSGGGFRVVQLDGSQDTGVAEPEGQRLHQRRAAGPQPVHRSSLTCPPRYCVYLGPDIRRWIHLVAATVN